MTAIFRTIQGIKIRLSIESFSELRRLGAEFLYWYNTSRASWIMASNKNSVFDKICADRCINDGAQYGQV